MDTLDYAMVIAYLRMFAPLIMVLELLLVVIGLYRGRNCYRFERDCGQLEFTWGMTLFAITFCMWFADRVMATAIKVQGG